MKILLGDFNAKVGRENIFNPTIGNESLHQDINDNGVRLVNFAKSKNLVVKSMMFPYRNIHKYTWASPDGNTHNQIDHVLIDRRRQSSILDVRSFRRADFDIDHYLVVAKLKERLAVNKKAAQKFEGRFNLRKLNEMEVKEKYQIEITNRFAALENLDVDEDVNSAWENSKENIKASAKDSLGLHELKQHKPWFVTVCMN